MRLIYLRRLLSLGVGGSCIYVSGSVLKTSSNGPNTATHHTQMNLKSVQVVFRHGARTPLKHIPGLQEVTYDRNTLIKSLAHTEVPYVVEHVGGGPAPPSRLEAIFAKTTFKGGVVAGQLTVVGKEQAYQLGQRLAKRYRQDQQFISCSFTPMEIRARSTNMMRCIESLQCVVAGLFGVESFNNNKPLVISVEKAEDEILYPNHFSCPALRQLASYAKKQYANTEQFKELVKQIELHTVVSVPANEYDIMQLRDHIVARKAHGLEVPEFLEQLEEQVDRAAVDALVHSVCGHITEWCVLGQKCAQQNHDPVLPIFHGQRMDVSKAGITLGMGRAWHMITQNMQQATDLQSKSKPKAKMHLYSCHDSSLVPLLISMGCYDNKWPPYSADIIFELYEDTCKQHWVKVSYCGKDQVLAGCTQPLIPLERFMLIVKDYIIKPDEYKAVCGDIGNAIVPPAKFD